eukprot:Sspe_Gene.76044::Locus_47512_Transcript_1_1_Confidence_1.000_Length_2233::g.76044::m.76044
MLKRSGYFSEPGKGGGGRQWRVGEGRVEERMLLPYPELHGQHEERSGEFFRILLFWRKKMMILSRKSERRPLNVSAWLLKAPHPPPLYKTCLSRVRTQGTVHQHLPTTRHDQTEVAHRYTRVCIDDSPPTVLHMKAAPTRQLRVEPQKNRAALPHHHPTRPLNSLAAVLDDEEKLRPSHLKCCTSSGEEERGRGHQASRTVPLNPCLGEGERSVGGGLRHLPPRTNEVVQSARKLSAVCCLPPPCEVTGRGVLGAPLPFLVPTAAIMAADTGGTLGAVVAPAVLHDALPAVVGVGLQVHRTPVGEAHGPPFDIQVLSKELDPTHLQHTKVGQAPTCRSHGVPAHHHVPPVLHPTLHSPSLHVQRAVVHHPPKHRGPNQGEAAVVHHLPRKDLPVHHQLPLVPHLTPLNTRGVHLPLVHHIPFRVPSPGAVKGGVRVVHYCPRVGNVQAAVHEEHRAVILNSRHLEDFFSPSEAVPVPHRQARKLYHPCRSHDKSPVPVHREVAQPGRCTIQIHLPIHGDLFPRESPCPKTVRPTLGHRDPGKDTGVQSGHLQGPPSLHGDVPAQPRSEAAGDRCAVPQPQSPHRLVNEQGLALVHGRADAPH